MMLPYAERVSTSRLEVGQCTGGITSRDLSHALISLVSQNMPIALFIGIARMAWRQYGLYTGMKIFS